tara:strand:+ start:432 stop:638 length:207 start_codon:yes stop_codon:yes gene_type:complete
MPKNKHWLEIDQNSVDVEIRDEDHVSRDNQEFAHTDGKKVIQKDNKRVPRFKTKLEELIWIAQQKGKK